MVDSSQQSHYSRFAPRDPIIYMHIFAGENGDAVIRTCAHEKMQLDFFRAEPVYALYIAGKNVKNCNVTRTTKNGNRLLLHLIEVWLGKYGNWKPLEIQLNIFN